MDKHLVVQGLAMRKIRLTFIGWLMQGDADGPIAARLRRRRPASDGLTGRPDERDEQRQNGKGGMGSHGRAAEGEMGDTG